MDRNGIFHKIRDLISAALLVVSISTGTIMVGPESLDAQEVSIAAFNIQVFGKSKRSNQEVMDILVEISQQFDIVVVQEIRDASEQTARIFLDELNSISDYTYALYEGPRVGRSSSKEQYAIYYLPSLVQVVQAYTLSDEDDFFEREPLIATMKAGNFDFTLVVCHIKPDDAENELRALEAVVPFILETNPEEEDIILLGDFNADGKYLDEEKLDTIFPAGQYEIIITNDMVTTTKTENTYDRIIVTQSGFDHEYIQESAAVFEFDSILGIEDQELVYKVSDHYPVYAEFDITLPDDD